MAVVLNDAYVELDSGNLSTYVKSVKINTEVADLETTAMGATAVTRTGGLKDGTLEIEFYQSFTASELDSILWPLLGTVKTFKVRPTSGAKGANNPEYAGSVLISEYTPIDGTVGDVPMVSVSWPTSGAVTRAVS